MTKEKRQAIKEVLNNVENKLYWLNVMVRLKELTEAEAGFVLTYDL